MGHFCFYHLRGVLFADDADGVCTYSLAYIVPAVQTDSHSVVVTGKAIYSLGASRSRLVWSSLNSWWSFCRLLKAAKNNRNHSCDVVALLECVCMSSVGGQNNCDSKSSTSVFRVLKHAMMCLFTPADKYVYSKRERKW